MIGVVNFVLCSLISICLHEGAHVLTARVLNVRVKRVGVNWKGFFVVREPGEPTSNAFITLAGPLANLAAAGLTWGSARMFAEINVVLGLSNLIPTPGTDGWRLWMAMRATKREKAEKPLS